MASVLLSLGVNNKNFLHKCLGAQAILSNALGPGTQKAHIPSHFTKYIKSKYSLIVKCSKGLRENWPSNACEPGTLSMKIPSGVPG